MFDLSSTSLPRGTEGSNPSRSAGESDLRLNFATAGRVRRELACLGERSSRVIVASRPTPADDKENIYAGLE